MSRLLCAILGVLLLSPSSAGDRRTDAAVPSGGVAVLAKVEVDPAAPQGPVADNSRCFVCHANYDFNEEKLALSHALANVGCVKCHGESRNHSADEDGLTPPDRMFPPAHIRFNCLNCHDWVKLVESDKRKTQLQERPDHQSVLDGTAKAKRFCTDCHGEHRLRHRTRVWNKRTGELIRKDATPRMLKASSTATHGTVTGSNPPAKCGPP